MGKSKPPCAEARGGNAGGSLSAWLVVLAVGLPASWGDELSPTDPDVGRGVAGAAAATPRQRSFRFDYKATVRGLPQGAAVRVWLPVPPSNEYQTVRQLGASAPGRMTVATEPKYGNRMLYFQASAPRSGSLSFGTSYHVTRREVRGLRSPPGAGAKGARLTDQQRQLFLAASAKVPVGGKPAELLAGIRLPDDPLAIGRQLYLRVDQHLRYDKSRPGYGRGDVLWACDSRSGNCTDFHSLFISLARFTGLPARFEIGFPLPEARGQGPIAGYHCWAFFFVPHRGWVPVDISEADKHPELKQYYFGNLTENRVLFTVGRDLILSPPQAGPPLNFFIYPYVEVAQHAWPGDKIQLKLRYADLSVRRRHPLANEDAQTGRAVSDQRALCPVFPGRRSCDPALE